MTNILRILCCSIVGVACAPYMPPVPTNPLGDGNNIRVTVMPVYESNAEGPLRMVLRKRIKSGWITLGDLCEAAVAGGAAPVCPAHRATHVTYVTPGEYKVRAEYVLGETGKSFWGSVLQEFEAGYVYTCEVTDSDTEACQRTPIGEASAAAAAPPVLTQPESTEPSTSPTPTLSPAPTSGCNKDIDCAGDLICRGGSCVSPAGVAAPAPPVEIVPTAPVVTIAPPKPPACDACPSKCAPHKQACNTGTVSSCYELGACLCECKLDEGGCGDSMTALTECIANNRAKANPKPAMD